MIDTILLAIVSTINPGIGLFGSIIKFVNNARYQNDIPCVLEIGVDEIISSILTEAIKEIAFHKGNQAKKTVDNITPYNEIVCKCDRCRKITHYYVMKNKNIICSQCLSKEYCQMINHNDRIYSFDDNIVNVHKDLKKTFILYNRTINELNSGVNNMGQKTFFVNCIHCGTIIETVCPKVNANVDKVKAEEGWHISYANFTNYIACTQCYKRVYLYWYFKR